MEQTAPRSRGGGKHRPPERAAPGPGDERFFPLRAVEHRLDWAGLNSAAFDLITTVDNMHFCKPQPEYYLEIAAMIGIPPEHCLMAGNDVEEDISSAAATGMGTFLADRFLIHRRPGEEPPAGYRGSLKDLADLIASFP